MNTETTRAPRVLIVGGGTAGWMAANLLQHLWADRGVDITLIESTAVGTVGVGEGTTPRVKDYFDRLGVPESEWMPACNATYKCGISFPGWTENEGYETYCHPFYSKLDEDGAAKFFQNANLRREGYNVAAHPDSFFVSSHLGRNCRAPIGKDPLPYVKYYGYHFDAALLGQYLRERATGLGVTLIDDIIHTVNQHDDGRIASVETKEHGAFDADFFIDCSGFKGLLIRETLGVPYISYRDYLFNDSAVAMPTAIDDRENIPAETVSAAMKCGWAWHIPLSHRFGNGYVYCSDYLDRDAAAEELRAVLGPGAADAEPLHLKWTPGTIPEHWKRNCLALGLSQGFLEPLEAPMLNIIQFTIEHFAKLFEAQDFNVEPPGDFNDTVNGLVDGTRDYLQAHYLASSRNDTAYWRDVRANDHMSDSLREIMTAWDGAQSFDDSLGRKLDRHPYKRASWYCLLAGMGRYPEGTKRGLRTAQRNYQRTLAACEAAVNHYHEHGPWLDRLYGQSA
ncbi:MAG: tryptophan halogenase family protein [Pseudomonadota bacterium]